MWFLFRLAAALVRVLVRSRPDLARYPVPSSLGRVATV